MAAIYEQTIVSRMEYGAVLCFPEQWKLCCACVGLVLTYSLSPHQGLRSSIRAPQAQCIRCHWSHTANHTANHTAKHPAEHTLYPTEYAFRAFHGRQVCTAHWHGQFQGKFFHIRQVQAGV